LSGRKNMKRGSHLMIPSCNRLNWMAHIGNKFSGANNFALSRICKLAILTGESFGCALGGKMMLIINGNVSNWSPKHLHMILEGRHDPIITQIKIGHF
jgi:hypothetical protein